MPSLANTHKHDWPADQIVAITEREFRLKLALKDLPIEQATVTLGRDTSSASRN